MEEDEYMAIRKHLDYMQEKMFDGKISYDKYMQILDEHYEVTEYEEAQEVEKWNAQKRKELEEQQRQKSIKDYHEQQTRKKETEKLLLYYFIGGMVLIIIIKMCKNV
jgi:hypothetical protein